MMADLGKEIYTQLSRKLPRMLISSSKDIMGKVWVLESNRPVLTLSSALGCLDEFL